MFVCPECGYGSESPDLCPNDGVTLADASVDSLLGQTIGPYRIARLLGAGGMGRVYLGVHRDIGSRVAIKVLSPNRVQDEQLVKRFFDEARAASLIRHESIVNIFDLSSLPDGRQYIVMEYLEGASLSKLIEWHGALPLGGFFQAMGDVLSALHAAHQKGIIHRDLKPDNIVVSQSGRAHVLDFGIAKLVPELSQKSTPTATDKLLGTPHYMSPEQVLAGSVDGRTDVYAVGVILFQGVTGQRPFTADSSYELMRKHIEEPPPSPRVIRSEISPDLEAVILKAMAKDPGERYPSARALAESLTEVARQLPDGAWRALRVAGGGTTSAQTIPSPAPRRPLAKEEPRSHVTWAIGGVVAVLALIAVLAALYYQVDQDADAPDLRDLDQSITESPPEKHPGAENGRTPALDIPTSEVDNPLVGVDLANFHPDRFLGQAWEQAKLHWGDATFVRMDVDGVLPDGRADLSLGPGFSATYRFISPSRAQGDPDTPLGVPKKVTCLYYVIINNGGVMDAYELPGWECDDYEPIPAPRCSVEQVWQRAIEKGAPRTDAVAAIGLWAGPGGKPRWSFSIRNYFSSPWIEDDCR